jgi:(p)ppGpp synthase/HD superfamily hydrolase
MYTTDQPREQKAGARIFLPSAISGAIMRCREGQAHLGCPTYRHKRRRMSMQGYSDRYEAALVLAARAHRNQLRKGSDIPYVVHVFHVSAILLRYGFAEDVAIAGLLHDVVEDQDLPLSRIESDFGPAVAGMVRALSETKREDGEIRPWEARKEELLDQLRRADPLTAAIKAADTLHNSRRMAADLRREGPQIWRFFSRGPQQSLWYYGSVVAIVRGQLGAHPLVDELAAAVQDLERAIAESSGA